MGTKEAAAFLGLSPETLRYWKDKGILVPRYKEVGGRRGEYYDAVEVAAFKAARDAEVNPEELRLKLAQTYALAHTAQRRVDALELFLGISSMQLSMRPDDIQELWEEATQDCRQAINGRERVSYWADRLFGVTDVYLTLVASVLKVQEPWVPFLELSRQLRLHQNIEECVFDPEARMAYARLHCAAERLRASVFSYCVTTFGRTRAIAQFPNDFGNETMQMMLHATEPL